MLWTQFYYLLLQSELGQPQLVITPDPSTQNNLIPSELAWQLVSAHLRVGLHKGIVLPALEYAVYVSIVGNDVVILFAFFLLYTMQYSF